MILVLASQRDPGAAALVAGWAGARLLTPADLSVPGWVLVTGPTGPDDPPGRGVADGVPFRTDEVTRVVSLLGRVDAAELSWIAAEHRSYVAAEMTAVLGHWLATLGGRCVVAPSHVSLAGPSLPTAAWADAAGLEVGDTDRPGAAVTVVGREVFVVAGDGPPPGPAARRGLVAMAAAHGAPLLSALVVTGGGGRREALGAVLPAPVVRTAAVRDAVRRLVDGPAVGRTTGAGERVAS